MPALIKDDDWEFVGDKTVDMVCVKRAKPITAKELKARLAKSEPYKRSI